MNLAASLADAQVAGGRGDAVAVRCGPTATTYAELARAIDRAARAIAAAGVGPRDRVALLLPDGLEFVCSFIGAAKLGAVPVTLSTLASPDDHRYMLQDCGARVAVAEPALAERAASLGLRVIAAPLRAHAADAPLAPVAVGPEDWCFWQYSSGTTGRPKAVMHTHRSARAPAELHGRLIAAVGPDDVVHSVAKLFFSYGLNNALTVPLRAGAAVVLNPGRPRPQEVLDLIARERVTVFYAVPTFYAALLAAVEGGGAADLSSVRTCISAGEALPKAIFDRWRERFGLEILDGIGSTEIGYIAISNATGRARGGTSGELIPGYQARVVDEAGQDVGEAIVGELYVRGPSLAAGYWNDPERTARTFRDGWIATGDRYARDGDGYYRSLGRTDDMLKVGGSWVSPLEVESALLEHPAVLECAVVGTPDADELVKPHAWVVVRDTATPGDALAAELRAFVKERLAPYKYPRWIEFVDELPKTATGKLQRFRLREGATA